MENSYGPDQIEIDGEVYVKAVDRDGKMRTFYRMKLVLMNLALKRAGGSVDKAAKLLGMGRATMYRYMAAVR